MPRAAELHRLIALTIARKASPLTGDELRLLRKHLGYSGEDFAKRIGMSREHVSRMETEAQPIGSTVERLIRLMVAHEDRAPDYSLDELISVGEGPKAPLKLEVKNDNGGWKSAA